MPFNGNGEPAVNFQLSQTTSCIATIGCLRSTYTCHLDFDGANSSYCGPGSGGVVGVYANRFSNVKVNLAKIYNEKKEKKKKTPGAVKIKGGSV